MEQGAQSRLGLGIRLPRLYLAGAASVLGGLLLWELVSRFLVANALFLAAPSQIFAAIAALAKSGELWRHMSISAVEFALGYAIASVLGVALSTVFSRVVACAVMWALLGYRIHLKIKVEDFFSISRERLGRILHIGLPAAGEQISWFLAFMTVTAFTARMGDQQLATQSYVMQLVWCVLLFSIAIGLATEVSAAYITADYKYVVAFVALLIMLGVRPTGLIGART